MKEHVGNLAYSLTRISDNLKTFVCEGIHTGMPLTNHQFSLEIMVFIIKKNIKTISTVGTISSETETRYLTHSMYQPQLHLHRLIRKRKLIKTFRRQYRRIPLFSALRRAACKEKKCKL